MDETSCKALMAAIILASLTPPEEDDEVCIFDMAASLAEDLYAHVVGNAGDNHAVPLMFQKEPPKGQAN